MDSSICAEMQCLSGSYFNKLTEIWSRIFPAESTKDNQCKLLEHVKLFYDDLIKESLEKEEFCQNDIANLFEEADMLRRVLKTEVHLPSVNTSGIPLMVIHAKLDQSLEEMRETLRLRKEEICELLLQQEALCDELGEQPRPLLDDPLPTAGEILDFRKYLQDMKEMRAKRTHELSTLRRETKLYLATLNLEVCTEIEDRLLNHRQIKLNKETFYDLQHLHQRYGKQVEDMQEKIDSMKKKLEILWNRLDTSPATRNKFSRLCEYNQQTFKALSGELQRCEDLKSQNIKMFVKQIREEIKEWWDRTLKSDVQRNRFTCFTSHTYTDDLLALHEMELEDLKQHYETNKEIFELYTDRKILWDRMTALEAKANDPGRFNNRGGQLLREEKERKTIANKLPKIEEQITNLVLKYEQNEKSAFLVNGQNILDVMQSEWDQKKQAKEKHCTARKQNGLINTPSHGQMGRTPMSTKNTSAAMHSMRRTPSTQSLSIAKRGTGIATTSAQKRKLKPSEKTTPLAKRSLMVALNSPSVFVKPSVQAAPSSTSKLKSAFKSPMKKAAKVIATTIRRHSGNKRKSLNRSGSKHKPTRPRIVLNSDTDSYTDVDVGPLTPSTPHDDTYNSFKNCIEPAARSSILHHKNYSVMAHNQMGNTRDAYKRNASAMASSSSSAASSTRQIIKRTQRHMENIETINGDASRLAYLPKPRLVRTPSKQHLPMAGHSPASTSIISGSGRKLTTKNLPILI